MSTAFPIICDNLTKYYGASRGLENLNLQIEAGEIFGFLGPNGAGKTTTIRMLMGLIRPTRGTASIEGMDVWRNSVAIKYKVGNIPGDVSLYENMRVHDHLNYIDRFRPGPHPLRSELMERFQLDADKKVKALSRGNKQKLAIVLAIMHDPDILILDEPTLGLDPLMQQEFYKILGEFRQRGKTVFLSSHILSEVERACDRVGIVREGKLVDVRAVEDFRKEKIRHMEIVFEDKVDLGDFKKLPQVISAERLNSHVRITVKGDIDALIKQVAQHTIVDLTFTQPSLEEFFMSFYSRPKSSK